MRNHLLKRLIISKELLPRYTHQAHKILIALLFILVTMQVITVRAGSSIPPIPTPQVVISSLSGSTISFFNPNGEILDRSDPQFHELPHLVLLRNGKLTEPVERTLIIELGLIDLPPSGAIISIEVSTQNAVKSSKENVLKRLQVWQESKWIPPSLISEKPGQRIEFHHEFIENLLSNGDVVPTPTDYFQINIRITPGRSPSTNPLFQITQDFAFLMENQWLTNLPLALESTPGSPPKELIVYYCDMFFPLKGEENGISIPRHKINQYMKSELIPAILDAYQTESMEWGFPWYKQWRGYREDENADRLSIALTKKETWYHGEAPAIGNAYISINLHSEENNSYNNLTESLVSNFYHEMFHNHQRNINFHHGGDGDIDGSGKAWQFFSEGMAVLASSVGQPEVQFSRTPGLRSYLINANGFLAGGGSVKRDIYKSYQDINPYHASIYWRYLYEQCGGMTSGIENPKAGMQIIRNVLNVLYSKEIIDIQTSTKLVESLPGIMNKAFQLTENCPFENYEDSLNKFAKAIYSLKLENGRCTLPGKPQGCGFYDPADLYLDLPIPMIKYSSDKIIFESSEHQVPESVNSFGVRFVEVELGQSSDGNPFNLQLISTSNSPASFDLQILKLISRNKRDLFEAEPSTTLKHGNAGYSNGNSILEYSIPEIELENYDRLAIIITRTDNQETSSDSGGYSLHIE